MLTLKEFADKCGVSKQAVKKWIDAKKIRGAKQKKMPGQPRPCWFVPKNAKRPT